MKLTYRGTQYELTAPQIATVSTEVIGKYRGVTLAVNRYRVMPAPSLNLFYRGASYRPAMNSVELTSLSNAV